MACHHHHSNCATTPCYCNHHCCYPPPPPPSSLQQSLIDPLLQTLTSVLQPQQQPHYTHINYQEPNFKPHTSHSGRYGHNPQTQSFLSSLLQRITILESSLLHFSSASSSLSNSNLRDVAARVIQTHFRAFLVHRSRTLRQLKELAFIKSSFSSLKSSVSSNTPVDSYLVSRKVTELLVKLNSIQSGDPMITDGKRSIGREMVSFLESIDGFVVKKAILSKNVKSNSPKFVRSGNGCSNLRGKDDGVKGIVQRLSERLEKIEGFSRSCENDQKDVEFEGLHQFVEDGDNNSNGIKRVFANVEHDVLKIPNDFYVRGHDVGPKVKKTVRFNDNGNIYTVYGEADESNSNEDGSSADEIDSNNDQGQAEESLRESDRLNRISKSDEVKLKNRSRPRNIGDSDNKGYCWDRDGNLVFSPPMPVKMESRTDLTKKKKAVQIVT